MKKALSFIKDGLGCLLLGLAVSVALSACGDRLDIRGAHIVPPPPPPPPPEYTASLAYTHAGAPVSVTVALVPPATLRAGEIVPSYAVITVPANLLSQNITLTDVQSVLREVYVSGLLSYTVTTDARTSATITLRSPSVHAVVPVSLSLAIITTETTGLAPYASTVTSTANVSLTITNYFTLTLPTIAREEATLSIATSTLTLGHLISATLVTGTVYRNVGGISEQSRVVQLITLNLPERARIPDGAVSVITTDTPVSIRSIDAYVSIGNVITLRAGRFSPVPFSAQSASTPWYPASALGLLGEVMSDPVGTPTTTVNVYVLSVSITVTVATLTVDFPDQVTLLTTHTLTNVSTVEYLLRTITYGELSVRQTIVQTVATTVTRDIDGVGRAGAPNIITVYNIMRNIGTVTRFRQAEGEATAYQTTLVRDVTLYVDDNSLPVSVILPQPSTPLINNNPYADSSGHPALEVLQANAFWSRGLAGEGVRVAVIGSGFNDADNVLANFVEEASYNFIADSSATLSTSATDALLARFIAGRKGIDPRLCCVFGLAYDAEVAALQVTDDNTAPEDHIFAAYEHALTGTGKSDILFNAMTLSTSLLPNLTVHLFGGAVTLIYPKYEVSPALISLGVANGDIYTHYFREAARIMKDKDAVAVWAAGDNGWNSVNGGVEVTRIDARGTLAAAGQPEVNTTLGVFAYDRLEPLFSRAGTVSVRRSYDITITNAYVSGDQSNIMGAAPLYEESLMGKWIVVAAGEPNNVPAMPASSNACGAAMHWCLTAPGSSSTGKSSEIQSGSYYAATHVAGALALLRSHYRSLPMQALVAILLKTAIDAGEKGVDPIYGHGFINLPKAISLWGEVNLVLTSDVVHIKPTTLALFPAPRTGTATLADAARVVLENGVAVSAINLPAPAAVLSTRPYSTVQYNANPWLLSMRADVAYDRGYFGQGATVAYILPHGVNRGLPELRVNTIPGVSIGVGPDGAVETSGEILAFGIGSGLVGAVAAATATTATPMGVAPRAKVIPMLIPVVDTHATEAAFNRAAGESAQVILAPWQPFVIPGASVRLSYYIRRVRSGVDGGLKRGTNFPVIPEMLASGYSNGIHNLDYYKGYISHLGNLLRDKDSVVVLPTAVGTYFNGEMRGIVTVVLDVEGREVQASAQDILNNADFYGADGTTRFIITSGVNQPGIMAEAPLFNGDLLGKWMVVVPLNEDQTIVASASGCGAARHWCIAAHAGGDILNTYNGVVNIDNRGVHNEQAAALVAGALAVLRSRFPAMPMQAVAALLLGAADDIGEPGVDGVYGQGRLNLGAAITVQGDMDLVTGINSITAGALVTIPRAVRVTTPSYSTVNLIGGSRAVYRDGVVVTLFNVPAIAASVATPEYDLTQYMYTFASATLTNPRYAYDRGYFGQGVAIAYIGDGVNSSNPRIAANLQTGASVGTAIGGGINTGSNTEAGTDIASGLAVLMAGVTVEVIVSTMTVNSVTVTTTSNREIPMGVAPRARIIPLKIHDGFSQIRDAATVAFSLALENYADIILMPWQPFNITSTNASVILADGRRGHLPPNNMPVMAELLLQGYAVQALTDTSGYTRALYSAMISNMGDAIRDRDALVVIPSGEGGWKSGGGNILVQLDSGSSTNQTAEDLIKGKFVGDDNKEYSITTDANQPGVMAEAPLFHVDLLGKWLVVVGADENGNPRSFNNGCGGAMYWCVTALDDFPLSDNAGTGVLSSSKPTTSAAAAHVAGLLALMRSRFPQMPMQALLALVLKNAEDLGPTGVDREYGHGAIRLANVLNESGEVNLVLGLNTVNLELLSNGDKTPAQVGGDVGGDVGVAAKGLRLSGLSGTDLGRGFGKMGDRLRNLQMAVSYLGGAHYYETALSNVTDFHGEDVASLGNAAADMFGASRRIRTAQGFSAVADERSGRMVRAGVVGDTWRVGYDICTECDEESWRMEGAGVHAGGAIDAMGNAFFGANEQGAGAAWSPAALNPALGGVEFFSAVGLGEDAEENTYQQYGLRWRGDAPAMSGLSGAFSAFSGLSLLAEWSHIEEGNSLLGSHGDVLGVDSASSRQARLELQGALPGALSNWRIHGGYTQGWSDADLNGTGLITGMSGLRYAHWHVESSARNLLQGADELRFGLSGAPRITGDVHFKHYRAGEAVFVEDLQYALPSSVREERFTMHELSDSALIWRLGYKWRVTERQGVMDAALGWEAISGSGASAGDHAASFQLRWTY